MKKKFRKAVLIIMAALSVNFSACVKELNNSNAQEIVDLLNQKYGIEFEVKSIGNRLASNKMDTVTAYCYPTENEKILFKAVMNIQRELVEDNYPVRVFEITAGEFIEEKFKANGIEAVVAVSAARLSTDIELLGTDVEDVIERYPDMSLTFTTILRDDADSKKVYETVVGILEELYSGTPEMSLGTMIWKYSAADYEECEKEVLSTPDISNTVLEQHKPISKVNLAIVKGELNKNYDTFRSMF